MCARSPPAPWCCCADGKGARVWRTGVSDIVGVTSVCVTARGVRGGLARRNLCEVWAARKPSRGARRSCHIPQRASPGGGSGVQNQSKFILTCIQELREIAYRIAPLNVTESSRGPRAGSHGSSMLVDVVRSCGCSRGSGCRLAVGSLLPPGSVVGSMHPGSRGSRPLRSRPPRGEARSDRPGSPKPAGGRTALIERHKEARFATGSGIYLDIRHT